MPYQCFPSVPFISSQCCSTLAKSKACRRSVISFWLPKRWQMFVLSSPQFNVVLELQQVLSPALQAGSGVYVCECVCYCSKCACVCVRAGMVVWVWGKHSLLLAWAPSLSPGLIIAVFNWAHLSSPPPWPYQLGKQWQTLAWELLLWLTWPGKQIKCGFQIAWHRGFNQVFVRRLALMMLTLSGNFQVLVLVAGFLTF